MPVSRANDGSLLPAQIDAHAAAVTAAHAAIDALPEEPPRWERARSLATYAQTLLTADLSPADLGAGGGMPRGPPRRCRRRPMPQTLGQLEGSGHIPEAIELFTQAHRLAEEASLSVRLRAALRPPGST